MVVFLVIKTMAKAACRAFAEKLLKVVYVNVGAMWHSAILFRFYRRKTHEHNLFYIKSVTPTAALAGGSSVITGRIFSGDCWRFLSRLDSSPPDIYVILARSSRFTTPGACNEEKNTIQITREGLWERQITYSSYFNWETAFSWGYFPFSWDN